MMWANKINGRLNNVLQVPLKRSTFVNRFARGRAACTATNVEIREFHLADHREDVGVCKHQLKCAKWVAEMWKFEVTTCRASRKICCWGCGTSGMSSRSGSSCMCRKECWTSGTRPCEPLRWNTLRRCKGLATTIGWSQRWMSRWGWEIHRLRLAGGRACHSENGWRTLRGV